jgi:formyltetrahydrofolate deformylase
MTTPTTAILLAHCPDRQGLVATLTEFIFSHGGNILYLDQHVDREHSTFFVRIEWDLSAFSIPHGDIAGRFSAIAGRFGMTWDLRFSDEIKRMALFVSKADHCLYDILARWQSGELRVDLPLIISNHPDLKPIADLFKIDYRQFEITRDNKAAQEQAQIALVNEYGVDFIVLARYMQILSPEFVATFPNRIINIHHSFLPAFVGSKPYHQAYERGVKIIGATSHYVTSTLDAGPIIEQDITRVTHKDTVADMVRKGKDLEKTVLSRAVWLHVQNRVLAYGNKTIVFE